MALSTEERFERIEGNLEVVTEGLAALMKTASGLTQSLNEMAESVNRHIDASNTRVKRIEENAAARMTRIEENLDALIRTITAEHTNGRQH